MNDLYTFLQAKDAVFFTALGLFGLVFSFVGDQHPTNLWKGPLTPEQKRVNRLFYRIGGAVMLAWGVWRFLNIALAASHH